MAKKSKSTSQPGQKTKAGFVPAEISAPDVPDYVVVELRYEAPVAFTASRFAAPAAAAPLAESLNKTLAKFDIEGIRSHFGLPASVVRARVEVAATLPPEPDPKKFAKKGMDTEFIESGFVQVVPEVKRRREEDRRAPSTDQKSVWKAYVAPRPVPAMPAGSAAGSRNFEPSQGYLDDAPNGIGAAEVWNLAGAKGKGITICDIEGNWNRSHEDLPKGIPLARRHGDQRSRMEKSWNGGAGRDGFDPGQQGLRRHQPSSQGRRPLGRHQRRLQHGRQRSTMPRAN